MSGLFFSNSLNAYSVRWNLNLGEWGDVALKTAGDVDLELEGRVLDAYDKLLVVLAAFEDAHRYSLGALSEAVRLPKSTVHRALSKLKSYGFVAQDSTTKEYFLGYRFRAFAKKLQDTTFIGSVADAHVRALASISGESSFLTVVDGVYALCVARTEATHPLRITMEIGSRAPLHRGASNIILLAHMSRADQEAVVGYWSADPEQREALALRLLDIQRHGFVYTNSELSPGATAVAVPVLDRDGDLVAALSLSGPTERLPEARARSYLPALREHADAVARELGFLAVPADAGGEVRKRKGAAS